MPEDILTDSSYERKLEDVSYQREARTAIIGLVQSTNVVCRKIKYFPLLVSLY